MKEMLNNDIVNLVKKLFDETSSNSLYVHKNKFFLLFLNEYPLQYQHKDKPKITVDILANLIKKMDICSKFRFKKHSITRYKFIRNKVYR